MFEYFTRVALTIATVILLGGSGASLAGAEDVRAYQHGIDFVPAADGGWWLIWSSSGHPPTGPQEDGNWPHDVYRARISADSSDVTIVPEVLIERAEAQEPASAAAASNGNIMVTMEDGWNARNTLAQRYGVYDGHMRPVRSYPQDVFDGGHSGHVAAAGDRFVVFYSDEWVDGGGVDDLGSGDDVLARVYDAEGRFLYPKFVATGKETRDWWPLVAGGATRACLVWQRFVDGELYADLMVTLLDVKTGRLEPTPFKLRGNVAYYTYSVEWLAGVERFLIMGANHEGGGFAILLDEAGRVAAKNDAVPALVRESQSVARDGENASRVVQAIQPEGLVMLDIRPDAILEVGRIADDHRWSGAGTDGVFLNEEEILMVSLSKAGLVTKKFRWSTSGN